MPTFKREKNVKGVVKKKQTGCVTMLIHTPQDPAVNFIMNLRIRYVGWNKGHGKMLSTQTQMAWWSPPSAL